MCDNVAVCTNGAHAYHSKAAITQRHHKVKEAIGHVFQGLHNSGNSNYTCHFETKMSTFGILHKPDAPDTSDATVDFYLENPATNHIIYTDVMVTHPAFNDNTNWTDPKKALKAGVVKKYKRYVDNYPIVEADIIPLVFDTYGGYADVTYQFLRVRADEIGGNDPKLCGRVLRLLRDRIAVALHTGQARVINSTIARNRQANSTTPRKGANGNEITKGNRREEASAR